MAWKIIAVFEMSLLGCIRKYALMSFTGFWLFVFSYRVISGAAYGDGHALSEFLYQNYVLSLSLIVLLCLSFMVRKSGIDFVMGKSEYLIGKTLGVSLFVITFFIFNFVVFVIWDWVAIGENHFGKVMFHDREIKVLKTMNDRAFELDPLRGDREVYVAVFDLRGNNFWDRNPFVDISLKSGCGDVDAEGELRVFPKRKCELQLEGAEGCGLFVPRKVLRDGKVVNLILKKLYVRSYVSNSLYSAIAFVVLSLIKIVAVAILMVLLGEIVSLEVGVFVVLGFWGISYFSSLLMQFDEYSIEKWEAKELSEDGVVRERWWWERGMMLWSRVVLPVTETSMDFSMEDFRSSLKERRVVDFRIKYRSLIVYACMFIALVLLVFCNKKYGGLVL